MPSMVTSTDIEPETAVKLGKTPKLRYDDQVRNLLDAGVWRLGDEGRPTAFVTIELDGKDVNGIPPNAAYGTSRAYTATRHSVRLPE